MILTLTVLALHVDQSTATFDKANPGLGDIDSGCCTFEVLDLDLSRFNLSLTGFAWPCLTSDDIDLGP